MLIEAFLQCSVCRSRFEKIEKIVNKLKLKLYRHTNNNSSIAPKVSLPEKPMLKGGLQNDETRPRRFVDLSSLNLAICPPPLLSPCPFSFHSAFRIGHLRVAFSLCFNARLSEKLLA